MKSGVCSRLKVALTFLGPRPAGGVLVLAHRRAHAAGGRALAVHMRRVERALVGDGPDGAGGGVGVDAFARLADPARVGAVDESVPRVFGALLGQGPAGAVVVLVLAGAGAHAAAARGGWGIKGVSELGQWTRVCPGFSVHCSVRAQPGQSLCLSLHVPVHTPQLQRGNGV
jgi:hypothetical protein